MRRRLVIASLCFAWLCANGAIWDVVQVVAWTRMFAGYSESLSVGAALRETFDGRKPCALCRVVAKAKAAEQTPTPQQIEHSPGKITLALDSSAPFVLTKLPDHWPDLSPVIAPRRVEPVPLPPPRA